NFNVVGLVDTSGNVVERFAYDAFGVFSVLTPTWTSRASSSYDWVYLHQGGRWDADGGVYSFRHREYSPKLGRWMQNDPIGFAGGDADLYRFVGNDPTNLTDPSGLQELKWPKLPAYDPKTGKGGMKQEDWLKALFENFQIKLDDKLKDAFKDTLNRGC